MGLPKVVVFLSCLYVLSAQVNCQYSVNFGNNYIRHNTAYTAFPSYPTYEQPRPDFRHFYPEEPYQNFNSPQEADSAAISSSDTSELIKMSGTPFILSNGQAYRDMLTIEASKSVANFAENFQSAASKQAQNRKMSHQQFEQQSPLFLTYPFGFEDGIEADNSIFFTESRLVRHAPELLEQRRLAALGNADLFENQPLGQPVVTQRQQPLQPHGIEFFDFNRRISEPVQSEQIARHVGYRELPFRRSGLAYSYNTAQLYG